MKKSKDWVRETDLHKLFQALLDDGASLDHLTGYEAAKHLGVDPGGEFYRKFNRWKDAEKAKEAGEPIIVPGETLQAFRAQLDAFQEQVEGAFVDACRTFAVESEGRARQEVKAAQQEAARDKNEVGELIDRLCETEDDRDAAKQEAAELAKRVERAETEVVDLKAKLAASEHLLEQLMARIPLPNGAAQSEPASAEAELNLSPQADATAPVRVDPADSDELFPLADQVTGSAAPQSTEADDEQA